MSTESHAYSIDNLPPFMQHWKDAVESGSTPDQIAQNCYDENGELKGTIATEFVQGYEKVRDYFVMFTDGKDNVQIQFETIEYDRSTGEYIGDYTFRWQNKDDEDNITKHSLAATYRFKPTDAAPEDAVIARHFSDPRYDDPHDAWDEEIFNQYYHLQAA